MSIRNVRDYGWPYNLYVAILADAPKEIFTIPIKELEERVDNVLSSIENEKDRETLYLYFRENKTSTEIANEYLNCIYSAVSQRINRSLRKLREVESLLILLKGTSILNFGLDTKLWDIQLDKKLQNVFDQLNVVTVRDLLSVSDRKLLTVYGVGKTTLDRIHKLQNCFR